MRCNRGCKTYIWAVASLRGARGSDVAPVGGKIDWMHEAMSDRQRALPDMRVAIQLSCAKSRAFRRFAASPRHAYAVAARINGRASRSVARFSIEITSVPFLILVTNPARTCPGPNSINRSHPTWSRR
jgi:hypothetical protein